MSHWDFEEVRDRLELAFRRAKDQWKSVDWDSEWYLEQREWIKKLAREYGISPTKLSAVVAVLSPQVSWDNQKKYTPIIVEELHAGYDSKHLTHPGFLKNKEKAWVVWNHEDYSVVRGPKVQSFWANLMGNPGPVTVDTHMFDIATGARRPFDRKSKGSRTTHRAGIIAKAIESIANESAGAYYPAEVQAIIWTHHRRMLTK